MQARLTDFRELKAPEITGFDCTMHADAPTTSGARASASMVLTTKLEYSVSSIKRVNNLQHLNVEKLDESTACRQLKSPQSLSGRSIHLNLVTKWSWSWSWMTYCHLLCGMSIDPPILRYSYFKIWPWKSMVKVMYEVKGQGHVWPSKFKGHGYGQVQTHWSHLRPGVQSICLLFVSWQSDHFWLRYSKFYIWPWKFKVKVMAKVKPDGHIWALKFNRYVCFSFRGNRTIFGWDIANSIFDLEKSRPRSRRKSTKI